MTGQLREPVDFAAVGHRASAMALGLAVASQVVAWSLFATLSWGITWTVPCVVWGVSAFLVLYAIPFMVGTLAFITFASESLAGSRSYGSGFRLVLALVLSGWSFYLLLWGSSFPGGV